MMVIPPKNFGMTTCAEPESSSQASHSLRLPDKITTPKISPRPCGPQLDYCARTARPFVPRPSPVHTLTLRQATSWSRHLWPCLSKLFRVYTGMLRFHSDDAQNRRRQRRDCARSRFFARSPADATPCTRPGRL